MTSVMRLGQAVNTTAQTADPYAAIGAVWSLLYTECQKHLTAEQCAGLMGDKPVYYPPSCKTGIIPWWGYALIGFGISRLLRL